MNNKNINNLLQRQMQGFGEVFLDQQIFNASELTKIKEFIINDLKENLVIERHMKDIQGLFPKQLQLDKNQLAQIRHTSTITLDREKADAKGVPWMKPGGVIRYSIRDIATWMMKTTKTIS